MSVRSHLLHARGVAKSYGSTVALREVGLTVDRGEIVGLLGPNGAGKSTLIRIVCGLLLADAGTVDLASDDRRSIGYCPQRLVVWPDLTCIEQLEFLATLHGVSDTRQAAERELRRVDLWDRRDALAATLSGGMKRRLSVAMALVHDPELLVLDEAEVGLDPEARVSLRALLRTLAHDESKGIVLSTHAIVEVESLADRVVILDRGEVIADGSPRELTHAEASRAVVELELPESQATEELLGALATRFGAPTRVNGRVILHAPDTLDSIDAVVRCVREHGIEPQRLGVRRPSLEDVFVQLTGRGYAP
jgi:ABC-2 type transport system ATP-binding protein